MLYYKIKKDEGRINSYLKSISGNNIQNFKNKFFENNLDFELFLDEVDTEIRWQQLIYTLYGKKIDINEAAVNVEVEKIIKERSNVEEFEQTVDASEPLGENEQPKGLSSTDSKSFSSLNNSPVPSSTYFQPPNIL